MSLLLVSGLNMLGFTLPTVILPALRAKFALSSSQVGLISSSYAGGVFFSVMVLPMLSDLRGRKPVLMTAHTLTTLGFVLQYFAIRSGWSYNFFLLTRFGTGLFAGCNPLFKAYIADAVPQRDVPQYMMYRDAMTVVSILVGPALGGFLASQDGVGGPLMATAVAHFTCLMLLWALVEEPSAQASLESGSQEEPKNILWGRVSLVMFVSTLYVVGQCCFGSFLPLLMADSFGYNSREIGLFITKVSTVALAFQIIAYKPLLRSVGVLGIGTIGSACLAAGLAGMGSSSSMLPFWIPCVSYAIGSAIFPATLPTLLSSVVPRARRGLFFGVDSMLNNFCRVVAPICLGLLYTKQPSLCFGASGATLLLVMLLIPFLRGRGSNRND